MNTNYHKETIDFFYQSPVGLILIQTDGTSILALDFLLNGKEKPFDLKHPLYIKIKTELDEYFEGVRRKFTLPLKIAGTDFQKSVWDELLKIPYGKTASYQDIAIRLHKPKAMRAVGGANHVNPVAIIIPCHRVIGKNGSMTGYASGIEIKEYLLSMEKQHAGYKNRF